MNEQEQNRTIDYYINKCPMFNNYNSKLHNKVIYYGSRTISEIDDIYIYDSFVLIGENKTRDSHGCHKKMVTQIKRFKRYEDLISRQFGFKGLKVHYFYAHFDYERLHIEYISKDL